METQLKLLTVEKAAAALDCHSETIRRAIRSGRLGCYRFGGLIRISPEQLRQFLDASFCPAKSPPDPTTSQRDVVNDFRRHRSIRKALGQ
jgi:excisionase family DNA binding protein